MSIKAVDSEEKNIVLAFSGGLDTSFCVPWLRERGWQVHTVFADTGGVSAAERAAIEARAQELGAASHVTVDGGQAGGERLGRALGWAGRGYRRHGARLGSARPLAVWRRA